MALSALSLNVTDSQDYKINFPAVLREQFGFTFPKVTASTSDNKTFSAESENFMGSPATVTIVNNVITRMAPGIIRDIVRQFVCSPNERVLPQSSRRAIPFEVLMVHDKTQAIFRMQNGNGSIQALNSRSGTDRDAVQRLFEYKSLLPPATPEISFEDGVLPHFSGKTFLKKLFDQVTTSEDFSIPALGWSEEEWTRLGDSSDVVDSDDTKSFDAFLRQKFSEFYGRKGAVRGSKAEAPNPSLQPVYDVQTTEDLSKWIEFVLNVRTFNWNALYLRPIVVILYVIDTRLVVFTVDKNTNMLSCLSSSADVIRYQVDTQSATIDNEDSLRAMLGNAMRSFIDVNVLKKYQYDTGNRMLGGWQTTQQSKRLPTLSERAVCYIADKWPKFGLVVTVELIARCASCKGVDDLVAQAETRVEGDTANVSLKDFATGVFKPENDFNAVQVDGDSKGAVDAALGALNKPKASENIGAAKNAIKENLNRLNPQQSLPVLKLIDQDLAAKSFEAMRKWLADGGDEGEDLKRLKKYSGMAKSQDALLDLLQYILAALKEEHASGGTLGTLQADIDRARKNLDNSKPGAPNNARLEKEFKAASERLATNEALSAQVARYILAAKDFKKSLDDIAKTPEERKMDGIIAERNALINVQAVPDSSNAGTSAILLLHAFLMYFFDIGGVRSLHRDWDAVRPTSAQDVTRMFIEVLDIPS
ncbi:hypothetical protein CVIRNUC_003419 [Coccomyxa viridis]|uniref:Uncharacterized protein n=1 Tax=Coccomyxa viridis TaxID=1274662 RepID=A0AAV1I2X0_9CHLO|nr:hypothetical protein CVIRNUC_003419 [Coccomyxa viridis]